MFSQLFSGKLTTFGDNHHDVDKRDPSDPVPDIRDFDRQMAKPTLLDTQLPSFLSIMREK